MYTPEKMPRRNNFSSPEKNFSTPVKGRNNSPFNINREIQSIQNQLGSVNWALAGSAALRAHSMAMGRNFRTPRNINIVVRGNPYNLVSNLRGIGYTPNGAPSSRNNTVHMFRGNHKLDILRGAFNKQYIGGVPTMTLRNLLRIKENLARPEEIASMTNQYNRNKTLANVEKLRSMLKNVRPNIM